MAHCNSIVFIPLTSAGRNSSGTEDCLLSPPTTTLMLTPAVENTNDTNSVTSPAPPIGYGMGWFVRRHHQGLLSGRRYPFLFSHTGSAVGASSVLTVLPQDNCDGAKVGTVAMS